MRQFVVLLVLAVAAASANTIGWPGFPEGRIINGYEAGAGEAPFIVSLQTRSHFCAGTLITSRVVLTAAHCMTNPNVSVVGGAHSHSDKSDTQTRKASSARQTVHEKYGGGVGPYDIGLIFLDEPFDLTALDRNGKAPVSTISLPSYQFEASTDGVLFGWGIDNSGKLADRLQKLDVDILSYADCKSKMPMFNSLADSNICTYTSGKSDGACNGDSGGPLVTRKPDGSFQQVGIVSWGYTPCATTKNPSVYTSVGHYLDWIAKHIDDY